MTAFEHNLALGGRDSCGRDYCDANEIMSIADVMANNGMKEAGYEYINLDGKAVAP